MSVETVLHIGLLSRSLRGRGLQVWTIALALLVSGPPLPAHAVLRVAADLPAAGVVAGDRVIALRGVDGSGQTLELPAIDPLSFQWNWLRCSALRSCKVLIERGGQSLALPLWIDDVVLLPEREAAELALLSVDESDPEQDARLAQLAERWQQAGSEGPAVWLSFRRSLRALRLVDLEAALELEQHALALLTTDPVLAAQVQLDFSVALMGQGKSDLAAARLERLLDQDLPPEMRIRATRARAGIEFGQSRLAEAEAYLRTIEALARSHAPGSHLLATTLNSLAVVIRPQGRLQEARGLFEEALAAAMAFESDSVLQAMIRSNIGLLERAAGDLAAAEIALRQSVDLLRRLHSREALLFDNQSNLALVLLDRGRTREAAALWNLQLPADDDLEAQQRAGRVQQNLALVYAQQGNLEETIRHLQRAAEYFRRTAPDTLEEANAQLDLGLYLAQSGNFDGARQALDQALRQHRRIAPEGTGVVGAHDALASVALQQGQAEAALDLQRQAMKLRDAGEQPNWRRDFALTQLARIELMLDRPEAALATLDQAERIARAGGRDGMLATALALRGEVLLQLGRLAESRRAACAGVDQIEALRGTSPSGAEYRTSFVHTAAPIYQSCMDALLAVGDHNAALALYQSERRLMLNALIADRDLRFADLPATLLAERRTALVDLQQIAIELEAAQDAATTASLKERRSEIRQRLRRIDERTVDALPRLANWQVSNPDAPAHAGAGEVVVAYSVRPKDTLRIVLHSERPAQIERLPIGRGALAEATSNWRRALLGRAARAEREQASALHRWLLADLSFSEELSLLIVPDGPLHALPFAALLDESGRRLIERQPIMLSALLPAPLRPASASDARIDLLALADSRASGIHASLPGVAKELAAIERLPWPRIELLRDAEAIPTALRQLAPQARRLHFAVHGVNDPHSPMDSALLLHDAEGRADPLPVWDIFESLRLQAELVVLAACDTAPGASIVDDGWLGLTRAFQFAGAEQVVSALWSVDDDSTANLMAEFHRQLAEGQSAAIALARAQRQMLALQPPREGQVSGSATTEQVGVESAGSRGVGGLTGSKARQIELPYYWAGFHVYLAPR